MTFSGEEIVFGGSAVLASVRSRLGGGGEQVGPRKQVMRAKSW